MVLNLVNFSNIIKREQCSSILQNTGGHQHNLRNKFKENVREFNKYTSLIGGII